LSNEQQTGARGSSPEPKSTSGLGKATTSKGKTSSTSKGAVPDDSRWYRLVRDFPFPVQVTALMKNNKGKLLGVGVFLRIPVPWEEYLEPWPSGESLDPEGKD
jgi:hypothetical protein